MGLVIWRGRWIWSLGWVDRFGYWCGQWIWSLCGVNGFGYWLRSEGFNGWVDAVGYCLESVGLVIGWDQWGWLLVGSAGLVICWCQWVSLVSGFSSLGAFNGFGHWVWLVDLVIGFGSVDLVIGWVQWIRLWIWPLEGSMDLVIGFDQWIWSLGGINGFGHWI